MGSLLPAAGAWGWAQVFKSPHFRPHSFKPAGTPPPVPSPSLPKASSSWASLCGRAAVMKTPTVAVRQQGSLRSRERGVCIAIQEAFLEEAC